MKLTQSARILRHLQAGRTVTPLQALHRFGCFRLSGRIYDLRRDGHNIERRLVQREGSRVAEYRLVRS